jgi:hypothetical protein
VSTAEAQPLAAVRTTPRAVAAAREVLLLGSLFVLYELGRHVVRSRGGLAFTDADAVLQAERFLRLPSEVLLQHALLHSGHLVHLANVFYVSVHFPATIAFLLWTWIARPAAYFWARSLLVTVTAVSLVLHVTFPLAPPRMMAGDGFVDTMALFGPSAYGDGTQSVTNQYAAMPSLHAAWALVIAVVLVVELRSRWRWLAALHPLVTVAVIVSTANHYWLDVIAAALLVLGALLLHGLAPARRHALRAALGTA